VLNVFIGFDPRQPIAYNVCQHSVVRHSSKPVSITPLILSQLPITRRGLTEFTFSRFLVPWLMGFKGKAVFMDADIVVTGDIAELFEHSAAVSVMQEQERFEWASVMTFDCEQCKVLTPEFVQDPRNQLFDLAWAPSVGKLPKQWNGIVGYGPTPEDTKLWHFTRGIPVWKQTQGLAEDLVWFDELEAANYTCDYADLMGHSIHHQRKAS